MAALRLSPEFYYPTYNGHGPTAKYTFNHQLVQIIRLTLLHALSTMSTSARAYALSAMSPGTPVYTAVQDVMAGGVLPGGLRFEPKGAATIVGRKVFAAPDRLSRDEYLSLPVILMLAHGIEGDEMSEVGGRWAAVVALQQQVENSRFLREYDCGQA